MELKPIRKNHAAVPKRVLVCEDDGLIALALEQALRFAGVRHVTICPSAKLAMAALEDARPDAIILDINLADRSDGWAIAELAAFLGPRPPRIIFATASPGEIPPEVARLGTIFEKPYDPELLVEAMISGSPAGFLSRVREALYR